MHIKNTSSNCAFTLLEEDDVVLAQSKVVVFLKELDSGGAGGARGHDIPRNDNLLSDTLLLASQSLELEDTLGLDLEERLCRGQLDVVATLRGGGSEAGALSSSEQDDTDLVLGNLLQADGLPLVDLIGRGLEDRIEALLGQRSEESRLVGQHGRGASGGLLVDTVHSLDVEVVELVEKGRLVSLGEVIVVGEEMALTGSLVAFLDEVVAEGGRGRSLGGDGLGSLDGERGSGGDHSDVRRGKGYSLLKMEEREMKKKKEMRV